MTSAIEGRSSTASDNQSLYSTTSRKATLAGKAASIHLIASSTDGTDEGDNATIGGRSYRSTKSTKTLEERAKESGVPVHKLAFDDFHNTVSGDRFHCP